MGNQPGAAPPQAVSASGHRPAAFDTRFEHKPAQISSGAPADGIASLLPSTLKDMIPQGIEAAVKDAFQAHPTMRSPDQRPMQRESSAPSAGARPQQSAQSHSLTPSSAQACKDGRPASASKGKDKGKGKGKPSTKPCVDGPLCLEQLRALDELNGAGKGKGKGQGCLESFATDYAERGSFVTRVGSMDLRGGSFRTDIGGRADSFAAGPSAESFTTRPPASRFDKRLPIGVSFPGNAQGLNTTPAQDLNTRMPKANSFAAGSTQTLSTGPSPAGVTTQVARTGSFVSGPTAAPAKFGPRMDLIRE